MLNAKDFRTTTEEALEKHERELAKELKNVTKPFSFLKLRTMQDKDIVLLHSLLIKLKAVPL